jgi:hypothetical protein
MTMASAPAGTVFAATAHKGLEAFNIDNGAAVAAGTAGPTGSFQTSPTASLTKTTSGYDLTTPDGTKTSASASATAAASSKVETAAAAGGHTSVTLTNGVTSDLTYSTYGSWLETDAAGIPLVAGVFATGVITTAAQMPTTGTAKYTGSNVTGFVFTPSKGATITGGNIAINVDFSGNSVGGAVTEITTADLGTHAAGQMSAIYLSGGTVSGSGFAGNAVAAAPCACTTIDIAGTPGTFGGKFYGPAAAEVAGSISMSGAGNTVLAAFGAKKN